MSGHTERVQALIAAGRVEEAKAHHNAAVVLAKRAAERHGQHLTLRRKLPAFREAKKALDKAEGKQ